MKVENIISLEEQKASLKLLQIFLTVKCVALQTFFSENSLFKRGIILKLEGFLNLNNTVVRQYNYVKNNNNKLK
jgi:hypothetical protein